VYIVTESIRWFLSDFGDDERLRTLRQKAEGFKTFSYPGVGFVTSKSDRLRLSSDADVL
jgi:hypothetical protein